MSLDAESGYKLVICILHELNERIDFMKCHICGRENDGKVSYCIYCGTPIKNYKRKKMAGIIAGISGLAILAIVVFSAFSIIDDSKGMRMDYSKDEKIVRYADINDIENPRIFMGDHILFSETGAVLEDFFEKNAYFEYNDNYDHTMAAVENDDKLYYVDGQLKPRPIGYEIYNFIMCKDGGYILCEGSTDGLFVYDVDNDSRIQIADDYYKSSISSNGKYVVFSDNYLEKQGTWIVSLDDSEKTKISDKALKPIYISRDGKRAFFEYYDDSLKLIFYYNDGKCECIGSADNIWKITVNDDCTDMFLAGESGLYYYNSEMESLKKLLDDNARTYYLGKEIIGVTGSLSEINVCDAPTFRKCFITGNHSFYFEDENTRLLKLDGFVYKEPYKIDEDCGWLYEKNNGIFQAVRVTSEGTDYMDIPGVDFKVESLAGDENCDTLWLVSSDNELYEYHDGKLNFISTAENGYYNLKYDKYEEKLFFLDDDCLCSVKKGEKQVVREYDGCRYGVVIKYIYDDFIAISDEKKRDVVRIFGNYVDVNE